MDHNELIEAEAKDMAEAVNGGKWNKDYTEGHKEGWRLKVRWAMKRYLGLSSIEEVEYQYNDAEYSYKYCEPKFPLDIPFEGSPKIPYKDSK